jgi:hypothetical protein
VVLMGGGGGGAGVGATPFEVTSFGLSFASFVDRRAGGASLRATSFGCCAADFGCGLGALLLAAAALCWSGAGFAAAAPPTRVAIPVEPCMWLLSISVAENSPGGPELLNK